VFVTVGGAARMPAAMAARMPAAAAAPHEEEEHSAMISIHIRVDITCLLSTHSRTRLSRRALLMTETELNVIAAAAIMGLSRIPKNGYRMPAAIGMPSEL
jgi:hypothetical protein